MARLGSTQVRQIVAVMTGDRQLATQIASVDAERPQMTDGVWAGSGSRSRSIQVRQIVAVIDSSLSSEKNRQQAIGDRQLAMKCRTRREKYLRQSNGPVGVDEFSSIPSSCSRPMRQIVAPGVPELNLNLNVNLNQPRPSPCLAASGPTQTNPGRRRCNS
jgi:hypothetical protein